MHRHIGYPPVRLKSVTVCEEVTHHKLIGKGQFNGGKGALFKRRDDGGLGIRAIIKRAAHIARFSVIPMNRIIIPLGIDAAAEGNAPAGLQRPFPGQPGVGTPAVLRLEIGVAPFAVAAVPIEVEHIGDFIAAKIVVPDFKRR